MERTRKNINWINAVKAFCMLMVYVVHCEAYYGIFLGRANVFMHPVYVNAFFFVSGYLLFRKQLSAPVIDESCSHYYSSQGTGRKMLYDIVFRLWLPALLFSFVSFVPKTVLKGGDIELGSFFFKTFGGGTYWFVSALLLCQLFILFLLALRQRSMLFYVFVLCLMTVAGCAVLPFYDTVPDYYSF